MKKRLLLLGILALSGGLIWQVSNQKSDVEKLREKHAEYLKNHRFNQTMKLSKKERLTHGLPPNKYFEQEYLLEINPNTGRTHPENYIKLQQELNSQRLAQRVPGDAGDNPWVERGPNNVGGRTRMVMFDPNDATHKRVFAGGVSGGLWVNNDITSGTSSWTQVSISNGGIPESLSITCMTVDPNNSQIMYIGTGESYTGDDAVGNGVWKTTDGGNSWTNVYSDNFNTNLRQRLYYINDIKAWNNPSTNKTEVFIGVAGAYYGEASAGFPGAEKTGLYKTVDDGQNWTKVNLPGIVGETGVNSRNHEPNDIEISSDNTIWFATNTNIYGKGGGAILKSTNGSTFTLVNTIANTRRVEIAFSGTNKDKAYILAQGSAVPIVMMKTENAFASTSNISLPNDADNGIPANDFTRGQAFYDLVIEVNPSNDNIVYAGGIDLFRSTNSGSSWTQISKWSNNNNLASKTIPLVHADQHGWAFHPTDPNKAIIGNDGGVYYATSLSGAETSTTAIPARNKDYNVMQFYNGAIGQSTTTKLLLAGSQDNGTQFINGPAAGINSSIEVYGGDGAHSFIDKDGNYMIVSYVYNVKARLNLPYTGGGVTIANDQGTGSFINPSELDDNLDILYTNGSTTFGGTRLYQISRFKDIITSSPSRANYSDAKLTGEPTVLKVSPFTTGSTKLYVGTANGKLLKVENANTDTRTWTDISGSLFTGSISSVEFGANENQILVTFHNYGVTSIWYTENGGTSWTSKEGNFPDIPVKAILMNPLNNDEVIIGTELGVWKTGNFKTGSPSWTQSYNGMSNVKVTSLELRTADNTVLASTYGRGMYTGKFTAAVASVDDVLAGKEVFTMYPTINDGNFKVFAKNTLGNAKMTVFDIKGQQVYAKDVNFGGNQEQSISMPNVGPGVYIVNVVGENNTKSSGKIIIK